MSWMENCGIREAVQIIIKNLKDKYVGQLEKLYFELQLELF